MAAAFDQVGAFEDFEVFGDGREGDVEGCGEFSDGGFAIGEAGEDGTPRGIGERGEGGAEGISFGGSCGHVFRQMAK